MTIKRTTLLLCIAAIAAYGQRRQLTPAQLSELDSKLQTRLQTSTAQAQSLRARYQLDEQHSFQVLSYAQDKFGTLHVRHGQVYKGVPVRGAQLVTHIDGAGSFLPASGKTYANIDIATQPALSEAEVRNAIWMQLGRRAELVNIPLEAVDAKLALEIVPRLERVRVAGADPATGESNASHFQQQLRGFDLAYLAVVKPSATAGPRYQFLPEYFLVEANTGRVLRNWAATQNADVKSPATGVGNSLFSGKVPLNTTKNETQNRFELYDAKRGSDGGNRVRSLNNSESMLSADAVDMTDGDNTWGNSTQFDDLGNGSPTGTTGQTPAVDVFWAITRTWDMLKNVFNQSGLDGKGTYIEGRVHWKKGYTDARWNGAEQSAFFGDGVMGESNPLVPLWWVGHELGHGLWGHYTAGGSGEAAGLNEGHGDIMGSIVEFYTYASKGQGFQIKYDEADWNFGSRIVDPLSYSAAGQIGLKYYVDDMASREEHTTGCTYGHMFVLLVQGASKDPSSPLYSKHFPNGMAGIGIQDAADVWHLATTAYPPADSPTFDTMKDSWIAAAEYLFGTHHNSYKAVVNAWAAIGVGSAVPDFEKPEILVVNKQIDETEGFMQVHVSASDDTGITRVEYGISGGLKETDTVAPYSKLIDISTYAPGTPLTGWVRVYDQMGNMAEQTFPFTLKGVNQLIKNGGFESGTANWSPATTEMTNNFAASAFVGSSYLRFRDNGHKAEQKIDIPASAIYANLSYRLRVENPGQDVTDMLQVYVLDANTNKLIQVLEHVTGGVDTTNDFYNNYSKRTFNLIHHKGKSIKLMFASILGKNDVTRFVIDAVSLVYAGPKSATVGFDLDEGADVLRVKVDTLTGVTPNLVRHVDFRVNGSKIGSAIGEPWHEAFSIAGAQNGTYDLTLHVIGHDLTEIVKSSPAQFTIHGRTNLLLNSGFEQGATGWTFTGNQSGWGENSGEAQFYKAHTRTRFGRFYGSGQVNTSSIRQKFTVPNEASGATLSFYVKVESANKDASDRVTVRIKDAGLQVVHNFGTINGTNGPTADWSVLGYQRYTFNVPPAVLSKLKGVMHTLEFFFDEDADGAPSRFFFDDISIVAPTPAIISN